MIPAITSPRVLRFASRCAWRLGQAWSEARAVRVWRCGPFAVQFTPPTFGPHPRVFWSAAIRWLEQAVERRVVPS